MNKRILFLGAHCDDIEISCGGTIARMVQEGHAVTMWSLSKVYNVGDISHEFMASVRSLGVSKSEIDIFPTRMFYERRQDILQLLYDRRNDFDLVYSHSIRDGHADHSQVGFEVLRAFKNHTIYTFASPFNSFEMDESVFVKLTPEHMEKKMGAIKCYESQKHRVYMQKESVYSLARVRGMQCGVEYAEAFRCVKLVV